MKFLPSQGSWARRLFYLIFFIACGVIVQVLYVKKFVQSPIKHIVQYNTGRSFGVNVGSILHSPSRNQTTTNNTLVNTTVRSELQDPGNTSLPSEIFNSSSQYKACCDSRTILILFTTFKNAPDRTYPQSQIVLNWAQFRPWIQPVLYTPDTDGLLVELASKHGWHLYAEQGSNKYGTPKLKPMFSHAMEHYNTTFYAFANGDILFDQGLVDTLKYIQSQQDKYKCTFVTGMRWNFPYFKYTVQELGDLWPNKRIKELQKKSSLFRHDAEDYFIATRSFPWASIKDVVIGRPAYDNYLVSMAIHLNTSTFDATETVKAVHITLNGSVYAGAQNKDAHYNKGLIGKFNYNSGITSATQFQTKFDTKTGSIYVKQRWDPVEKARKLKEKQAQTQVKIVSQTDKCNSPEACA